MPDWTPEVVISPERAARLVAERWSDLEGAPVALLGAGFDNTAYRIGEWIFRFPRRSIAVPLLEREIRFLARLDGALGVAVPVPTRVGRPPDGFPFAGYLGLPGDTACGPLSTEERAALAGPAGSVIARLHAIPVPEDLGADLVDRANLGVRGPRLLGRLSEFAELGPGAAAEIAALAETPRWTGSPVWVHGDLYPRHLLRANGQLSGIIDWGDTHAGDPALDLSLAFTLLPPEAVPAFRAAYGPIDPDTWARARFHAWRYLLMIASYARETRDPGMARIVRWTAASLGVAVPAGMPDLTAPPPPPAPRSPPR